MRKCEPRRNQQWCASWSGIGESSLYEVVVVDEEGVDHQFRLLSTLRQLNPL